VAPLLASLRTLHKVKLAGQRAGRPDPAARLVSRPPRAQFLALSTSLFSAIQGIMARSRAPTSSIGWAAARRSMALKLGWPALHSLTHSPAKRPAWMSSRMRFISAQVRPSLGADDWSFNLPLHQAMSCRGQRLGLCPWSTTKSSQFILKVSDPISELPVCRLESTQFVSMVDELTTIPPQAVTDWQFS